MDKAKKENAGLSGRFPANLIHDNSEEVRECFPETKTNLTAQPKGTWANSFDGESDNKGEYKGYDLGGNCSRFFKSIPQDKKERGRTSVVCNFCGVDFDKKNSQLFTERHFCSRKCFGEWQSKFLLGDNSYN
jgi:hypothetical protein